jgi:hypothetical protein
MKNFIEEVEEECSRCNASTEEHLMEQMRVAYVELTNCRFIAYRTFSCDVVEAFSTIGT